MICLAYLSSAHVPMSADELGEVVEISRRNNAKRDVTGLLCHYDGSFLQFLEGPEGQVDELFDMISLDPRHSQILKVYRQPIETRAFSDWSMGIVRANEVTPAQQAFCQSLRKIVISADAKHQVALEGFLTSFRAWLR